MQAMIKDHATAWLKYIPRTCPGSLKIAIEGFIRQNTCGPSSYDRREFVAVGQFSLRTTSLLPQKIGPVLRHGSDKIFCMTLASQRIPTTSR
jgi:hypothetical protein